MATKDLNELITQMKNGYRSALQTFYECYGNFIYAIALKFFGDEQIADDVVNDIIVNVWNDAEKYGPIYNSYTWLYVKVVRYCINLNKRKRTVSLTTDVPVADKNFYQLESDIHFSQAISKLSDVDQKIIIYYLIFGFNFREIGLVLHISEKRASKRFNKAKLKIKNQLEKCDYFE